MTSKIIQHGWPVKEAETSAAKAIHGSITDASGSSEGQIEGINDRSNKQAEIIAMLIQLLVDGKVLTLEQIAPMLSYHYKVEE